jgi:hypothetical protein
MALGANDDAKKPRCGHPRFERFSLPNALQLHTLQPCTRRGATAGTADDTPVFNYMGTVNGVSYTTAAGPRLCTVRTQSQCFPSEMRPF